MDPIISPALEWLNLQCYCDLGSVPMTYSTQAVSFTLSEKSVTCYSQWDLTYEWSKANSDGSNVAKLDQDS